MGINQSNLGVDKCNAIINCYLATGKLGKLGCGPFSITGQPNAMGGREVGGLSNQLTAHLDITNPSHQKLVQLFWQSPTIATSEGALAIEMIEKIEQGKIKAIWIMATNPLVSLPDRNRVIAALKKCPLVVVSDCVEKNDTLAFADVKLPATTWLEKNGTVTNSERVISRQRGMISAVGEAKHDWKIICEVAQKMGFKGFDYQDSWQIFKEFCQLTGQSHSLADDPVKRLFDISALQPSNKQEYDALKPSQWPISDHQGIRQRPFADKVFSTQDGKAYFIGIIPVLPVLENQKKFPFVLNTGRIRDQWHTMTRTAMAVQLNQHISVPKLAINPADAKQKQLTNNDWVKIKSAVGEVILEVELNEGIQPNQCFIPIHWNQQFASHANISNVFPTVLDPISKQPQIKQVAVLLEKVNFQLTTKIHLDHELSKKLVLSSLGVFRKTVHQHCQSYLLATDLQLLQTLQGLQALSDNKTIHALCDAIKTMLGTEIQWLNLYAINEGRARILGTIGDKLMVFIECVDLSMQVKPAESPGQWLDYLFSQLTLSPKDKLSILTAKVAPEFLLGKQVCSCFKVHQQTIEQAIAGGDDTLNKLATSLRCGSGCGSCKAELSGMIASSGKKLTLAQLKSKTIASKDIITLTTC